MAIMLRQIKIPSRNVTGFVGGSYNRFGHYYAVREGDAYSWVEGYIGDGSTGSWVTFDPTPPAGAQPLEQTTGFFVYMRDLAEALSQDWNRYVVGYDLRKQGRIFDDGRRVATSRPGARRREQGAVRPAHQRARRRDDRAGGVRHRVLAVAPRQGDDLAPGPERAEVAGSAPRGRGRALPGARASPRAPGALRSPALPPLRHAEQIAAGNHPLGAETLALTEIYIETRFGHAALTEAAKRDFEQRVKQIRVFRAPDGGAWKRGRSDCVATGDRDIGKIRKGLCRPF